MRIIISLFFHDSTGKEAGIKKKKLHYRKVYEKRLVLRIESINNVVDYFM